MKKEIYNISVDAEYYKKNYDIFKPPNTKMNSVVVVGEDHEKDELHKILLKKYLKARDELRDYEFDLRYKKKNN
jgi:hypothetical protein